MKLKIVGQRLEIVSENPVDNMVLRTLEKSSTTYVEFRKGKRIVVNEDKRFYLKNKGTLILSKQQLPAVLNRLKESGCEYTGKVEVVEPKRTFQEIDISLRPGFDLRDDIQKKYHKFLLEPKDSYLCTLQTGKGKTGSTIISLIKREVTNRFCIMIPPRYHGIWLDAFNKFTSMNPKDVMVVSGRDALMKLSNISDNIKVVILSPATIREYVKNYYGGEPGFKPEDILNLIGSDHLIVDEVHEDFAGNFLNVLALNPKSVIALTATFSSSQDARKIKQFKEYFIPDENRLPVTDFDKYVNVVFCQFKFDRPDQLKFMNPSLGWYSHLLLEDSILSKSIRYNNYFEMIMHFVDIYYNYRHRILFLFSRKDMCRSFYMYLKKHNKFPKKKISTFIEGDPKTNLNSDVIISTGMSGGTGIDIQDLQVTVNTISTKSEYSSIQFSGRNRHMKNTEQYYLTLWATNILPQNNYKKSNVEILTERAKKVINNYYAEKSI